MNQLIAQENKNGLIYLRCPHFKKTLRRQLWQSLRSLLIQMAVPIVHQKEKIV